MDDEVVYSWRNVGDLCRTCHMGILHAVGAGLQCDECSATYETGPPLVFDDDAIDVASRIVE